MKKYYYSNCKKGLLLFATIFMFSFSAYADSDKKGHAKTIGSAKFFFDKKGGLSNVKPDKGKVVGKGQLADLIEKGEAVQSSSTITIIRTKKNPNFVYYCTSSGWCIKIEI